MGPANILGSGHDLELSRSRDVIGHVTIRFSICDFLLVVHSTRASVSDRFRDVWPQSECANRRRENYSSAIADGDLSDRPKNCAARRCLEVARVGDDCPSTVARSIDASFHPRSLFPAPPTVVSPRPSPASSFGRFRNAKKPSGDRRRLRDIDSRRRLIMSRRRRPRSQAASRRFICTCL